MDRNEQQNILSWTGDLGLEISPSQVALLGIFLDELCEWNQKTNLTGLISREKIIQELLLDSMIPSTFLPDQGRLLDVGSGAGFPGIPLAICKPGLRAIFLEANSKRTSFLRQVIRLTKLHRIEVLNKRIETSAELLHPEGYHVITARALADLSQVLKWCAPHLGSGGLIVSFQGFRYKNALEESSDTLRECRLFLHKTIPYTLPGKELKRNILIFMKEEG